MSVMELLVDVEERLFGVREGKVKAVERKVAVDVYFLKFSRDF